MVSGLELTVLSVTMKKWLIIILIAILLLGGGALWLNFVALSSKPDREEIRIELEGAY